MKKIVSIGVVSFLLMGCFNAESPVVNSEVDIGLAEQLVSQNIEKIEAKLSGLNATPSNYESEYKLPHLVRLAQASSFFDAEVEKLQSIHKKELVKLDRQILDVQKELKDLGGDNKDVKAKLSQLKIQKAEANKAVTQSVKSIKSRKDDRINALNESYTDVLLADFKTILNQK